MKSSESPAAAFARGPFNARVLRAAAFLPALSAAALCAAETAGVPDASVTAARPAPVAVPAAKPAPAAETAAPAPVPVNPAVVPATATETVSTMKTGDATVVADTVVVASRRVENLADVSPSVGLVTSKEIETRQLNTLAEALQTQPGIFISGGGSSPGQHNSMFTRGTESNHTAVLLDGRRLSPGLDGSSEIERYSTVGLDSVQFARGANSTLYGVNAIGGVIDMRTVDPLALAKPEGSAGVEAGSFGTIRGSASVAGGTSLGGAAKNNVGVSVAGDWLDTNGPVANSDYAGNHALVRADFRPVDSITFDTVAQVHDFEFGTPGAVTAPTPLDRQIDRGWLISPGVTFVNDDDFKARLFYSRSRSELVANVVSFGYNSDATVDMDQVSFQADWTPAKWVTVSAGYDYDHSDFSQTSNFGDNRIVWESNSVWGRAAVTTPDKDSELGVGGRRQWFDDFSDASTGEVFASQAIRATGTKFFAKLANSYAAPTAQDYFFNPPATTLKPEEVSSWEIGVKQRFLEKTSPVEFSATYFDNDMTNLITSNAAFQSFNINKAEARGVELAIDWRPVKEVRFYANGTIQDARATANSPATVNGAFNPDYVRDGDKLPRRPDYLVNVGVEFMPVKSVTLGLAGIGVMGREDVAFDGAGNRLAVNMGDYFTARAYASWRFLENAEVFGRVENIFDENYDASGVGYSGLPLAAYGGLRLRF